MEPRKQRAVGYLRQSKRKLDSISFDIQRAAIEEHAKRNNLELVAVHGDEGISGLKGIEQRPGLRQAMDVIRQGGASILLVWRFSRVSRNRLHQAMILQELKELKAGIQAAMEPIDTSTSAGAFGMDVLMSLAQMEATQRGEGWKEAHDARLRQGLPPQGRRVFGYRRDRRGYEVHQEEAALVREAYRMFLAGNGFPTIAQWLSSQGSAHYLGASWDKTNVKTMMDNPFYSGRLRFRGEQHKGSHEPLIEEETWQAYLARRRERAALAPRAKAGKSFWLSGLVKCGICGASMTRQKGGGSPGIFYLMCSTKRRASSKCPGNSVRMGEAEAYVVHWLYAHMDELGGQLPSEDEAIQAAREVVKKAEERLEQAKSERTKLQLAAVRFDWSDDEVNDAMDEVTRAILEVQNELDLARAQVGSFVSPQSDLELLGRGIELLGEGQQADEQWRQVIQRVLGKVVVAPRAEGLKDWDRLRVVR